GRLTLQSPCDGTIVARNTTEGALVTPETVLFRIADPSQLWVWCQLYERDLESLHSLLDKSSSVSAHLQTLAFPDVKFPGVVDLIASELDPQTRTIPVRVRVENQDGKLRPGMFATVTIPVKTQQTALCIPKDAVVSDEGVDFIFKHWKEDYWVRQDVKLGRSFGETIEVLGGLESGDWIVVSGAFLLKSDLLREKMGAGCAD
ncbi:MAG TPA: efflux RND transporter periplasmic adaptor subunit, partial [bacterium]|nr:efflux RND transporter periplasmic adaptor subunit [bacterium]